MAGKSLLERNEELAARNRAVAEQCQQKLEVRSSLTKKMGGEILFNKNSIWFVTSGRLRRFGTLASLVFRKSDF